MTLWRVRWNKVMLVGVGLLGGSLGLAIRRLRKERGLTLALLATRTGLSVQYLSELERDRKNPPLRTVREIARGLDLTHLEFWREVER